MNFPSPTLKILLLQLGELLLGVAIFCAFLTAGGWLKSTLHLILPANVLGLLLLLTAVFSGLVKVRLIERASRLLLFIMPLLFVPIYAGAGAYKTIWIEWGWLLAPVLVFSVISMWIFVGHLSQAIERLQRKISTGGPRP